MISNFNLDDWTRCAQVNIKLELEHVKQAKHKQQYQNLTWASEMDKRMKRTHVDFFFLLIPSSYYITNMNSQKVRVHHPWACCMNFMPIFSSQLDWVWLLKTP